MVRLNIYLLKREDNSVGYDEYAGAVLLASSEEEARALMASKASDEGTEVWLDKNLSKCEFLGEDGWSKTTPKVILTDYNRG